MCIIFLHEMFTQKNIKTFIKFDWNVKKHFYVEIMVLTHSYILFLLI